jgi:ketosteroid isomerase-like protein
MDASEAVAREAIRDVISRYNHAGDHGRLEALAQCFAPDGVLDLKDVPPIEGRAAIRTHLGGVVERLADASVRPVLRHHVSSILITLEGPDTANAASYFLVFTEIGLDHWGRYGDRFTRLDGQWLIAHRKVRVDGASPGSRMAVEHRVSA